MSLEGWLTFAVACAVVVFVPGPNVILTANYALIGGRSTGWLTIPGVLFGALITAVITLLLFNTLVIGSSTVFSLIRAVCALYLIRIAYRLWTAVGYISQATTTTDPGKRTKMFKEAFLVSVLNPLMPALYLVLIPQIIDYEAPLLVVSLIALVMTHQVIILCNGLVWLWFSSSLRPYMQRPATLSRVNRSAAICLCLSAVFAAFSSVNTP